ncbi:MAG: hypothetical protein OXF93_03220 [Acidobacteria bacterium]|nr:hypothetical protein [Acidobacteriota bacterium]
MSEIRRPLRIDEAVRMVDWPVLTPTDSVVLTADDTLVVCAGFEDRATAVLEMAVASRGGSFNTCIVEYEPRYRENRRRAIVGICRDAGLSIEWYTYDRRLPAGMGEAIARGTDGAARVYIDVSAMSRMLIVQILVAMAERDEGISNVSVLYTEAGTYPPSEPTFMDQERVDSYISSGVWELAAVPELSASIAQAEALRLIVFPSFNPAQLRLLLQELQPTFVDLVNGVPPRGENAWRPRAIRQCNAGALKGLRRVSEHRASTLDYRETLRLILMLYDQRSVFDKLILSPSGSKMQSVAVGLARSFLSDIQVVYPTPQEFLQPEGHTFGARSVYTLDLDVFSGVGG